MKIVNTGDIVLRGKQRYSVVIADDNIFVICKMNYSKKEGCDITHYMNLEIYGNQSDMNTLEQLHFSIISTGIKVNTETYHNSETITDDSC
jgi:hypothetical protein